MTEPDSKPSVNISGSASIKSTARGSDTGHLILTIAGLVLFIAGAHMYEGNSNWLSALGACFGLLIIGVGCAGWYRARSNKDLAEARDTNISVSEDQTTIVTSPAVPTRDVINFMRAAAQHRRPLPPPHGAVLGDPQDRTALRSYSEAERQAASDAIRTKELEHEARMKELMQRARKTLASKHAIEDVGELDGDEDEASLTQR